MSKTLFEKIIDREIPANILLETDYVVAFADVNPQAPTHFLVVPRKPIPTLDDLTEQDEAVAGKLLLAAARLARESGLADEGYRIVINCRELAGQTVFHLHLHVLGGRQMTWPPG